MSFPFNITNPGISIVGLLTFGEAQLVEDLAGISYATGDILYYDGAQLNRLAIGTEDQVLAVSAGGIPEWVTGGGGGYTNLTSFVDQTAWRVFYSNGDGDVTELALGADGTFLKSNGATSAPTFAVPAGSGDVSKVGTPVDNQIGVWTGDGTIEGDSAFTFDTTSNILTVSGSILGANGGLSAPTYGFSTDSASGTGMFLVSSGIIGFSIAGAGRAALSSTQFYPYSDNVTSLGSSGNAWSDLFLAEGGVINWDGGDVSLTQTGNLLALAGGRFSHETISSTPVSLGNLGTTEAIDWATGTYFYGTLDDDVTITHTNEVEGQSVTLVLTYDGSTQRSITWSDVDEWANGQAPTAPTTAARELFVTLLRINSTTYGFHNTGNASEGGVTDHGALTGLSDDDHTQYSIISSGAGAPGSTPSRVGAIYIDTTGDDAYISVGTADSNDWFAVGSGGTTDHGTLTGLSDDDHTQYSIISSGSGAPGSTPARVGAIYIDTTNDVFYFAVGTASSADWEQVSGLTDDTDGDGPPSTTPTRVGQQYLDTTNDRAFFAFGTSSYSDWRYVETTENPYTPPASDSMVFEDGTNNMVFEDGTNNMVFEA